MAVQKLGQKKESIEVSAPQRRAHLEVRRHRSSSRPRPTRSYMLELKQIRAAAGLRHLLQPRSSSTSSRQQASMATATRVASADPSLRPSGGRAVAARLPAVLALIVPLLLLAFWHVATYAGSTRLIPHARRGRRIHVRLRRSAASTTTPSAGRMLTHLLASMQPRLWRLRARRRGRRAARPDDRQGAAGRGSCSIRRSQLLRPIPVTAWLPLSMIFFGLGPALGGLPGVPRRVLSDPAQHDLRRALGRSRGCSRRRACSAATARAVPQGGAAGRAAQRSSPGCGSASASPGS